jgi:hypothetical protein
MARSSSKAATQYSHVAAKGPVGTGPFVFYQQWISTGGAPGQRRQIIIQIIVL